MSQTYTSPSIRSVGFFHQTPTGSASYSLDQGSLFLSGPVGQGKEALQELLTGWTLSGSEKLLQDSSMTSWYEWEGAGVHFLSVHTANRKSVQTLLVSGRPEESWREESASSMEEWQKIFKQEGRKTSKILSKDEYQRWILNQENPLSAALQKKFPSPKMSVMALRLMTAPPEANAQSWEQFWADPLIAAGKETDSLKDLVLEYTHMRTALRREEEMAADLPQLRKWHNQQHHLALEHASLSSQFQAMKARHQLDGEQLKSDLEHLLATDPEQDHLTALRHRIGWIEWKLEQAISESGESVSSPSIWWEARKILSHEKELLQKQANSLISQFSSDSGQHEEELTISDRLKQLQKNLPDKVSELERQKMKLEWLRKEKAREEQLQKEVHQSSMNQLLAERDRVETSLAEQEQEARRPRNTFRHWLEKHVPEWEKGPGKLLHPQVLESRGMFPKVERMNDLFYGISLHLEDLPEPEYDRHPTGTPATQLEDIRQQISDAQIQFLHEEKLLQNRYKQKTRLVQKSIQQAEYDLQLHHRESSRLRQKLAEIRLRSSQSQHKAQLDLQYQVTEIQAQISTLENEIQTLDASWECYLKEESVPLTIQQLSALRTRWKKELIKLERSHKQEAKKREQEIQSLTQQLSQWEQTTIVLDQIDLRPTSSTEETSPLVTSVAQWLERYELLISEELNLARSQEEWRGTWPTFEASEELILTLEPESIEARRSELASVWVDRISEVYKSSSALRARLEHLKTISDRWTANWQLVDPDGKYPSPTLTIEEHPLYRALVSLEDLVKNHEHAMAGAGLFQQQDPVQTLRKTIHVMDNLYDGWRIWQDGSTRLNFNLFDGEVFRHPHQRVFLNHCLSATLQLSLDRKIAGPVAVNGAEAIPPILLEPLSAIRPWVFTSLYPLPVPGNHLWVTTPSNRKKSWEALPFATR